MNQDLLLPLKSRRQSTDGIEEAAADATTTPDAADGDKPSEPTSKAAGKNVAFDLGSLDADDEGGPVGVRPTAGEAEDRDAPIAATAAGVKSLVTPRSHTYQNY